MLNRNMLPIDPRSIKRRTLMDYLLFICSAACISGVFIGFRPLNSVTIFGYGLALFWMLTTMVYRSICRQYAEYIIIMDKVAEQIIKNHKKENDEQTKI